MGDQQGDVVRVFGEQSGVELVRSGGIASLREHIGQHAGDGEVLGMGGVELLQKRQGFGVVLSGQHSGELGVQGRIFGLLLERCADQFLGFGVLLAFDEDVGEAGVGGYGFRIARENAAIGGFGSFVIAGVFGEIGGEKRVVGGFGGDLQRFKEFIGSDTGVAFAVGAGLVKTGERTPCTGFQLRTGFARIKGGSSGEFGVGVVSFALTGEQQAERQVRFKRIGIHFDGSAVKACGAVKLVLVISHVSGVKEGASVVGVSEKVGVEPGGGGFPVGGGDGGLGVGKFRRQLWTIFRKTF